MQRLLPRSYLTVVLRTRKVFQHTKTTSNVLLSPGNTPWKFTHDILAHLVSNEILVERDFVSADEEKQLMDELDIYLQKHRYQKAHWDYAITDYRETERKSWQTRNRLVIERLKKFTAGHELPEAAKGLSVEQLVLSQIHVLDLSASGEIKPHVDSVRYCGDSIAVLSLLSDAVLRLAVAPPSEVVALPVNQPNLLQLTLPSPDCSWIDMRIPRRSLYVMRGATRYLFNHAILSNEQALQLHSSNSTPSADTLYDVTRERRVSVICRSQPRVEMTPTPWAEADTVNPPLSNEEPQP